MSDAHRYPTARDNGSLPRWWRRTVIALATLILCSCRAPCPQPQQAQHQAPYAPAGDYGEMQAGPPPMAYPPAAYAPLPRPAEVIANWAPPGIERPWPDDEYLHDGGDQAPMAVVGADWRVHGVELEDTIVHYDTLDGRTCVEPSNRVHIYAPRFAAVRRVEALRESEQADQVAGYEARLGLGFQNEALLASTAMQPLQPIGDVGTKRASSFLDEQLAGALDTRLTPFGFQDALAPHEDFAIFRIGILDEADKPRLAENVQAALTWSHDLALQVAIDRKQAQAVIRDRRAQLTTVYEAPGCPKLQVCKVASAQEALPGEIVDFTIRFDNIGDQKMGNVTIIDNLTTRLEYIEGSAQASVKADFFTHRNEGESLQLRWEILDPLAAGQGGLVRFKCRVR